MSEAKLKNPNRFWLGKKRPELSGQNNPNHGKFGPKHPRWKANKQRPFANAVRQLFKYRQWRSDIFTRDDFTCVFCGVRGVYLEADHYPKMFASILREYQLETLEDALDCEELWDINNGRTLCRPCHDTTKRKETLTKH